MPIRWLLGEEGFQVFEVIIEGRRPDPLEILLDGPRQVIFIALWHCYAGPLHDIVIGASHGYAGEHGHREATLLHFY